MSKNINNVFFVFFLQAGNYLFPLMTIPLVSRIFGPDKIGLLAYLTAIVGYFTLMVNYSFNFSGVRRLTRNKEQQNVIFSSIFFSQFILLFISTVIFFFCLSFFSEMKENEKLSIILFSACITAFFTQSWILQANSDFKIISILMLFSKFITFILVVCLVNTKRDFITYSVIINGMSLCTAIVGFVIVWCRYKINLKYECIKNSLAYLWEDRFLFLSSITITLYTTTGVVILGVYSTNIEVAYYTSAQKIIDLTRNLAMIPIMQVVLPLISKKFGDDHIQALSIVRKTLPLYFVYSLVVSVGVAITSYFSIFILFGQEFLPSVTILCVLSVGLFSVFLGNIIGTQVMLNMKMDKQFLYIQVIVSVLSVGFNILVLPYGGGLTTALVWTVSEIIITFYQIVFLRMKGVKLFNLNGFTPGALRESVYFILGKRV